MDRAALPPIKPQRSRQRPKSERPKETRTEIVRPPDIEGNLIKRWGMNFVQQLGQNSYPTKPNRWQRSMQGKQTAPRVARSIEEAALEQGGSKGVWGDMSRILDFPGRPSGSQMSLESWEVDSVEFDHALRQIPM
ncbi:unnamed protein product [Effrenium voratum]|nr:unnamed protein product [Effrenium voratum]